MEYIPSVVQAIPGDNHTVFAYFSDGSIHHVDVSPLIARGGVFSQLNDEKLFRDALTVLNDTVTWDISGNRVRPPASIWTLGTFTRILPSSPTP